MKLLPIICIISCLCISCINSSNDHFLDGEDNNTNSTFNPTGLKVDRNGNMFIVDRLNHCIKKMDTQGFVTTIAGNKIEGYGGDGEQAIQASLKYPLDVTIDAKGNIIIADSNNDRVRKVDEQGIITTIAGNGEEGYSGDGGPATEASLSPTDIDIDPNGNIIIADCNNHRIRKINEQGIITTIAGNGKEGYSGDGGPATEASLKYPSGITVDATGNIFIVDSWNQCIRKINPQGIITTIAGNRKTGYSGDGGFATEASLDYPLAATVDDDGNIFIVDQGNDRIRKVDKRRIITTIAGNGEEGYSGDGGHATEASLRTPVNVALDRDGNIFIADLHNHCIRKVDKQGIITTVLGKLENTVKQDTGKTTILSNK